jgi:hypothetical protein
MFFISLSLLCETWIFVTRFDGNQNNKERTTYMSKRRTKKTSDKDARVKVGKLSQQDRELKNGEARNIRGGGGVSGGVLGDKSNEISTKLGR